MQKLLPTVGFKIGEVLLHLQKISIYESF